jgi:hypothetical protein
MVIVKVNEQQKEWAIKAAAGVVVFIFCYMAMIGVAFRNVAILRQKIVDSQKRGELYREVQNLAKSLDGSESGLATLTERSQILGKISDIAGQTQFHIVSMIPRTEPEGGYVKLRIEIEGQGNFFSTLKFLKVVEKVGAGIHVREISTLRNSAATSTDGSDSLLIRLTLETFLKQRGKKGNA